MTKKLRLLLLKECNRTCRGCCNKGWDLDALPECRSFADFDEIFLTGGEPLLVPDFVQEVVTKIRRENPAAKIILYTAWRNDSDTLMRLLHEVDGMTLTLHTRKDTAPFEEFSAKVAAAGLQKSLRVNVFHGVSTGMADLTRWKVKRNIRWIKDCPLPDNEVLMAYFKKDMVA